MSNNAASDNLATSNPTSNNAVANSVIVPSGSATPSSAERATLLSTVWVPGSDDKLHPRPVSKAALDAQKKYGDPTAALADIIRMAPKWFPPKTRVRGYHDDGKTVSINLSNDFQGAHSNFWSKAGEGKTELAVYALVNTASSASGNKAVVLKTDNNTFPSLGEFDTDGPLEPNKTLQAGAASDAGNLGGA